MWMKSAGSPGLWRRVLTAVGGALNRAILGKSGHDYMKRFAASDEYWDEALGAQRGWPQTLTECPVPSESEPVHSWTKPQLDDYLARNPSCKSTYETELQGTQCQRH